VCVLIVNEGYARLLMLIVGQGRADKYLPLAVQLLAQDDQKKHHAHHHQSSAATMRLMAVCGDARPAAHSTCSAHEAASACVPPDTATTHPINVVTASVHVDASRYSGDGGRGGDMEMLPVSAAKPTVTATL